MKRRDFLKAAGAAGLTALGGSAKTLEPGSTPFKTPRSQGKSVAGFRAPALETVRVGFIGVGARGSGHVGQMLLMEGVEVKAICDVYQDLADRSAKRVVDAGRSAPDVYAGGEYEYRKMLDRDDIDIVIIATPWEWHVPMCVDAMESGKHAFTEVPAATTVEDCWKLVDTSERTQRHCMMMENVCYGREELLCLNMCRLGVFGELLHGEAAYIHDLRSQMHSVIRGTGSWRTIHYMKRNGNLYPTHGLGPICQYMGINRGDRMDHLSSVGCNSRVRSIYAKENFSDDHKWNQGSFVCGDINTSIVRTVNGRTIMIQWDEQLPRPYTRLNFIQGTKGAWASYPNRCAIDGISNGTGAWDSDDELGKFYEKYEHPIWTEVGDAAREAGGHGGMDFVMLWRIVYCLRNGLPIDQDVYDAASWSVISPLSEWSVANRGGSIDVPDFTRGNWRSVKPLVIEP